jgi:hypothetical protein
MKNRKLILLFPFLLLVVLPLKDIYGQVAVPSLRVVNYELTGLYCNTYGEVLDDDAFVTINTNIRFDVIREVIEDDNKYYVIKVLEMNPVKIESFLNPQRQQKYESISNKFYGEAEDIDERDGDVRDGDGLDEEGAERSAAREADGQKVITPYVLVQAHELEAMSQPLYSKRFEPVAGPLVIPLKLRFEPFDFGTDVSFGAAVGTTIRTSRRVESNRLYFLISAGVTSLSIDSTTTKGSVNESTDLPGFYCATGAVLSLRNSVSLGVFAGWDFLSSKNENNWIYQGEPWLGIGVGVVMFNLKKDEETKVKLKQ